MDKVLQEDSSTTLDIATIKVKLEAGAQSCSDCQAAAGVICKIKKYFCSSCWIHYCNFRFRKRLLELRKPVKGTSEGGYRRMADGSLDPTSTENVLIYFDGSIASQALLILIRDSVIAHREGATERHSGFARAGKLPFPFSFTILFLIDGVTDEGQVEPGSWNNETINFLQSWLEDTRKKLPLHFPFPLVITRLERTLSPTQTNDLSKQIKDQRIKQESEDETTAIPLEKELQEKLCHILLNLKGKSSRLDFLQILRQRLVLATAKELGQRKVIIPENQTSLAVSMFSIMSSGRGEQLAEQMNLVTEVNGVQLCRPMIELSSDDLRDYVKVVGLEGNLILPNPKDSIDKKEKIDSMQRQCEEFIVSLQRDYPATVPTLTRTGGKLEPNRDVESTTVENCKLCQRRLTELEPDGGELWCYGCRGILNDMKRPELLQEIFS